MTNQEAEAILREAYIEKYGKNVGELMFSSMIQETNHFIEPSIAIKAIQLAAEPKWISVEDRLPNDDKCVIVCAKDGEVFPAEYDGEKWYNDENEEYCYKSEIITHWMPLPNKPNE